MAGGALVATGAVKKYPGRFTPYVFITCLISATGGLIFGYDIGISGGVTSMDMFLKRFFPEVLKKEKRATGTNDWCKFDSQLLTSFTSSLYLAALIASFFASTTTRILGRRASMVFGGLLFLIGAALNGAAQNVIMLIFGRIFLGIGVGFANQSIPVYLSEMAPANQRGALNMCFQLFITVGILIANLINYRTQHIDGWGWRLSLGLAAVPAIIITVGAIFLPDTPNSLIERGHEEKARRMLKRIRGTDDVDEELADLVAACEASKKVQHPWRNILEPKNRAQFIMSIFIPLFQQLTGINVIMFYAPVLFKTIGFGSNASLLSSVITGIVNVLATVVSIVSVDKVGRRFLFIEGGVQMFICQILVGAMLGWKFGVAGQGTMSKGVSSFVLTLICIYVAGFAWSWGPLGWLVPSEIFPLETRSAGQAINVSVNMLFTFLVAQLFLLSLCNLKFGLFFLFSFFVFVMTAFIILLLPETRNVPIEEMVLVWKKHWFWRRYFTDDDDDNDSSVKIQNRDL